MAKVTYKLTTTLSNGTVIDAGNFSFTDAGTVDIGTKDMTITDLTNLATGTYTVSGSLAGDVSTLPSNAYNLIVCKGSDNYPAILAINKTTATLYYMAIFLGTARGWFEVPKQTATGIARHSIQVTAGTSENQLHAIFNIYNKNPNPFTSPYDISAALKGKHVICNGGLNVAGQTNPMLCSITAPGGSGTLTFYYSLPNGSQLHFLSYSGASITNVLDVVEVL